MNKTLGNFLASDAPVLSATTVDGVTVLTLPDNIRVVVSRVASAVKVKRVRKPKVQPMMIAVTTFSYRGEQDYGFYLRRVSVQKECPRGTWIEGIDLDLPAPGNYRRFLIRRMFCGARSTSLQAA